MDEYFSALFQSSSLESPAKGTDFSMRSMWSKRGSDARRLFNAPHSPSANLQHTHRVSGRKEAGEGKHVLDIARTE
jgi:hypothetical protein